MSKGFDINQFLNVTYDAEFQTVRALVPVGEYYAYIKSFDVQPGQKPGTLLARIKWVVQDEELAKSLNREELSIDAMLFLDVDPEDSNILLYGVNQNLELGRIRKALNQNIPGQPWNFGMLENQQALIKIEHREQRDKETKQPTGETFDRITKYMPIAV
jgi:hypothetical protein